MSASTLASENARIAADLIAAYPGWDQEYADKLIEEIQLEVRRETEPQPLRLTVEKNGSISAIAGGPLSEPISTGPTVFVDQPAVPTP